MIVNYNEQGWEIFAQRAHGLLAAQLAMYWKIAERPSRWAETVLAVAEHDDAEIELQTDNLLTPQGGPITFSMKKFDITHCRRSADLALSKSRYIALLISMHMGFLYGEEPSATDFLNEQEALQKKWKKELNLEDDELRRTYALLEWCDACSLLLCQRKLQPEKRKLEVSSGPDGTDYYIHALDSKDVEHLIDTDTSSSATVSGYTACQNSSASAMAKAASGMAEAASGMAEVGDSTKSGGMPEGDLTKSNAICIDPWPFEVSAFSITAESRQIEQLHFANPAEFRNAFRKAPVKENVWHFRTAR